MVTHQKVYTKKRKKNINKHYYIKSHTMSPLKKPSNITRFQLSKYEWIENPDFAISPTEVIAMTRK